MKKLTLIIYTAVIVATLLCALVFQEYLNVTADSVIPALVLAFQLYLGFMLIRGHIYLSGGRLGLSYMRRIYGRDFKYSKNKHGEGSFARFNHNEDVAERKTRIIAGCVFLVFGAATIPFIFFFTIRVKWMLSLGILFVSFISATTVNAIVDIGEAKREQKEKREQEDAWQKELEEQKKREELGKWK